MKTQFKIAVSAALIYLVTSLLIGFTVARTPWYHYWNLCGALALALLFAGLFGFKGACSGSLKSAAITGIFYPLLVYLPLLVTAYFLPDGWVVQVKTPLDYERYDIAIWFVLGLVVLACLSAAVTLGGYFFNRLGEVWVTALSLCLGGAALLAVILLNWHEISRFFSYYRYPWP